MVQATQELARDAIFYAWRRQTPWVTTSMRWRRRGSKDSLEANLKIVINAFNLPLNKEIEYFQSDLPDKEAEEIEADSYPALWRHLLAKLVENALEHSDPDVRIPGTAPIVILKPVLASEEVKFALEIRNPVNANFLNDAVQKIGDALRNGNPGPVRDRGYGLIEAYKCCGLLGIVPDVYKDDAKSELVISLSLRLKNADES
jgi:hypothetical protein